MTTPIDICTPAELVAITKRTKPSAQVRILNVLGIDHVVHPDGCVLVHRDKVRAMLKVGPATKSDPEAQPDWEAMDGAA